MRAIASVFGLLVVAAACGGAVDPPLGGPFAEDAGTFDTGTGAGIDAGIVIVTTTGTGVGTGVGTGTGTGVTTETGVTSSTGQDSSTSVAGSTSSASSASASASSGTSSASSGGVPTTCAAADNAIGCCVGNSRYYCSGTSVLTDDCTTNSKVCGWSTTYANYGCVDSPGGADPSGTYPLACGGSTGSGSGSSSGSSSGAAPTWTDLYTTYLAVGTVGDCDSSSCHKHTECSSAADCFSWLSSKTLSGSGGIFTWDSELVQEHAAGRALDRCAGHGRLRRVGRRGEHG